MLKGDSHKPKGITFGKSVTFQKFANTANTNVFQRESCEFFLNITTKITTESLLFYKIPEKVILYGIK